MVVFHVFQIVQMVPNRATHQIWRYESLFFRKFAGSKQPATLKKIFVLIILKDFGELEVNLHKYLWYIKHLNNLLQLFKNSSLNVSDGVHSSAKFHNVGWVLYRGGSNNPTTCDLNLFATIINSCKIWI